MQLSYWEIKNWFTNVDFTIIGSGIVGLHCALELRERFPKSKIVILEKGILPQGASTKNAGFACFGSLSELIDDLKTHSEEEVIQFTQAVQNNSIFCAAAIDKTERRPKSGVLLTMSDSLIKQF